MSILDEPAILSQEQYKLVAHDMKALAAQSIQAAMEREFSQGVATKIEWYVKQQMPLIAERYLNHKVSGLITTALEGEFRDAVKQLLQPELRAALYDDTGQLAEKIVNLAKVHVETATKRYVKTHLEPLIRDMLQRNCNDSVGQALADGRIRFILTKVNRKRRKKR